MGSSVYDCMAYMIRKLIDNVDSRFFENYRAVSKNTTSLYNKHLYNTFPELFDQNGNIGRIPMPYNIDPDLVNKLYDFTDKCIDEGYQMMLAQMINKLDIGASEVSKNAKTDTHSTKGLNSNSEEMEIQILPRCYCS